MCLHRCQCLGSPFITVTLVSASVASRSLNRVLLPMPAGTENAFLVLADLANAIQIVDDDDDEMEPEEEEEVLEVLQHL